MLNILSALLTIGGFALFGGFVWLAVITNGASFIIIGFAGVVIYMFLVVRDELKRSEWYRRRKEKR